VKDSFLIIAILPSGFALWFIMCEIFYTNTSCDLTFHETLMLIQDQEALQKNLFHFSWEIWKGGRKQEIEKQNYICDK